MTKSIVNKIVGFVLFTIILLILFLCGELNDWNCHNKIDDDKIEHYFSILAAVATVVALCEIYNARKAEIEPDLFPATTQFIVKDIDNNIPFDAEGYGNKNVTFSSLENTKPPFIEMHNIGLGAAKYIEIQWLYNILEVEELIKNEYKYNKTQITETEHFGFLIEKGKLNINIPKFYFNCCGEKLNRTILEYENDIAQKPKLELKITYKDIQNNKYTKIFKVEIDAVENEVMLKFIQEYKTFRICSSYAGRKSQNGFAEMAFKTTEFQIKKEKVKSI